MNTCACGAGSAANGCCGPKIGTVGAAWTKSDWLGALSVRLHVGRMNYRVEAGLYSIGNPTAAAPVFVTSNYKLSFDHLRRALRGLEAWLLVLDTHGVNVWCAAGKGTFSTEELVRRIEVTGLAGIVSHRRLILPQLGAVGVAAEAAGFTVIYGPVRAANIPAWLNAGRRKDAAMRTVSFSLWDRLVLVPVEIANGRMHMLAMTAVALGLGLLRARGVNAQRGRLPAMSSSWLVPRSPPASWSHCFFRGCQRGRSPSRGRRSDWP